MVNIYLRKQIIVIIIYTEIPNKNKYYNFDIPSMSIFGKLSKINYEDWRKYL